MADLSEAIRRARGTRSLEEFAAEMGCSVNTVRRWESGGRVRSRAHTRFLEQEGVPSALLTEDRPEGVPQVAL
jgi:transcriptional regulator with XRE-family HTH domain